MSPTPLLGPQRLPLLAITVLVFALVVAAGAHGWRLGALAGVGVLFGASLFHASFGFASGYRRLSRKIALPYVARRWAWLNQTSASTAALVRREKENYNDLAEALSMGLGPLAYSTLLAKGGFWRPRPFSWCKS